MGPADDRTTTRSTPLAQTHPSLRDGDGESMDGIHHASELAERHGRAGANMTKATFVQ